MLIVKIKLLECFGFFKIYIKNKKKKIILILNIFSEEKLVFS